MAPDRPLVHALRGEGVPDGLVGGKAATLDRVIAAGCPVPPCRAVTVEAYRAFVSSETIARFLASLQASPIPDVSTHAEARAAVDGVFVSAPLPDAVQRAIADVATLANTGPVSVRSSATAEDLAGASFAGQYRSLLPVDQADVERAVRLVWASLWHPAPRAYRALRSISEHSMAMGVLVMQMVEPRTSGVLFTADPTGSATDVRLEVVEGLGEALVSGQATPDVFVAPRAHAAETFGQHHPVYEQLTRDALALEAELGAPQDIEWAEAGSAYWILQSRPITTSTDVDTTDDGFDVAHDADTVFTTAGIAEMLPGVLAPRTWEAGSWIVEDGFRELFDALGGEVGDLDEPHALLGRFRGRAALDLDRMRALVATVPGGSPAELERRYFGEVISANPDEVAASPSPWQGLRLLRTRHRAAVECEIVTRAALRLLDTEPDVNAMSDDELLEYRARIQDLGARTAAAEILVAALAAAAFHGVESVLERQLARSSSDRPDRAATLAQLLTRNATPTEDDTETTSVLDDVARALAADPDLVDAAALSWPEASALLTRTERGREVAHDFQRSIRRAGCTAVFAGPTWEEHPHLAWITVSSATDRSAGHTAELHRHADPDRSAVPEHRASGANAREVADLVAGLGARPWSKAVPASLSAMSWTRRQFLRREVGDAAELLRRRESTKTVLLMVGGVARRADLELGQRLQSRGHLDAALDIALLSDQEIRAAVAAAGPSGTQVAVRRHRHATAQLADPLPRMFAGSPGDDVPAAPMGDQAHGWGASPGRYRGRATIVRSPEGGALRRGDVLVARATDASWAPLFSLAGAIIVEEGGPLSHAAVVARELALPAVVNVPGIVQRLEAEPGGTIVTVDGATGRIDIGPAVTPTPADASDEADAADVAPERPEPPPPAAAGSFQVFVTGLIGASAALTAAVAVVEAVGSARGRKRIARQAGLAATSLADGVVHGFHTMSSGQRGLHGRRWYLTLAAGLMIVATAVAGQGIASYTGDDEPIHLGLALLAGLYLATGAVLSTRAWLQWPDVPPLVRRFAGDRMSRPGDLLHTVPPSARTAFALALLGVISMLAIVLTAEAWLLAIDEQIYDRLDAGSHVDRYGPDWFNYFGRPQVVIPLALVIAAFTFRCRVLALAYPLVIVLGGVLNLGLAALVGRVRPTMGAHVGRTDSFPSGHAIEVTLLLGLLPLALRVLTSNLVVGWVARIGSTAVLAVMLIDGVRTGSHWPSDHLAGFLIALTLVIAVHALARTPALHTQCRHHTLKGAAP